MDMKSYFEFIEDVKKWKTCYFSTYGEAEDLWLKIEKMGLINEGIKRRKEHHCCPGFWVTYKIK